LKKKKKLKIGKEQAEFRRKGKQKCNAKGGKWTKRQSLVAKKILIHKSKKKRERKNSLEKKK